MTIEQEARNEATRRAWDGELSHTDRDGFRARIDASEAFERGYIAGASRPVTGEMVEAAAREYHERGNGEGSYARASGHVRTSLSFRMECALRAAEEARR